jgi:hypothetical protein
MSKEEKLRHSVRLKTDKGMVLLRYGGVPSLACQLQNISEGGCRCVAPLGSLDANTANSWRRILQPTRPVSVEITAPPHLNYFPVDAEVRGLAPASDGHLELGLRFRNMVPNQQAVIQQAVLAVASDKVRNTGIHAKSEGPVELEPDVDLDELSAPEPVAPAKEESLGDMLGINEDGSTEPEPDMVEDDAPPPPPPPPGHDTPQPASAWETTSDFFPGVKADRNPTPGPDSDVMPSGPIREKLANMGAVEVTKGKTNVMPAVPPPPPAPVAPPPPAAPAMGGTRIGIGVRRIGVAADAPQVNVPPAAPPPPPPPPSPPAPPKVEAPKPPPSRPVLVAQPPPPAPPPAPVVRAPISKPVPIAAPVVDKPAPVTADLSRKRAYFTPPAFPMSGLELVVVKSLGEVASEWDTLSPVGGAQPQEEPEPAPVEVAPEPSRDLGEVSNQEVAYEQPAPEPEPEPAPEPEPEQQDSAAEEALQELISSAPPPPPPPPPVMEAPAPAEQEEPHAAPLFPKTVTPSDLLDEVLNEQEQNEQQQAQAEVEEKTPPEMPAVEAPPEEAPAEEVPESVPVPYNEPSALSEEGGKPLVESEADPRVTTQPGGDPFRGKKVGAVLVRMGKLTEAQVEAAVADAKANNERLGRYLLRVGLLSPDELCRGLALQSGLPMTDLSSAEIPAEAAALFPFSLLEQNEMVPFDLSPRFLCVASANPLPSGVTDDMHKMAGRRIEVFLAREDLVLTMLDTLRPKDEHKDRVQKRFDTILPVAFQFCNRLGRLIDGTVLQGQTLDLSEGGILLEGPAPDARLGEPDDLRRRGICMLVGIRWNHLEVRGLCGLRTLKIISNPQNPDWTWQYAMQILEMTSDDRRKLKEICIALGQRPTAKPG